MNEIFLQYGFAGAVILGLAGYIVKIESRHRKERDEWRDTVKDQFDKTDEREKETNTLIRENTNILAGLKTLLENRNRR